MKYSPIIVLIAAAVACNNTPDAAETDLTTPAAQPTAAQPTTTQPETPTTPPPSAASEAPPAIPPETSQAPDAALAVGVDAAVPDAAVPDAAIPDAAAPDAGSVEGTPPPVDSAGSSAPSTPIQDAGPSTRDAESEPETSPQAPSGGCASAADQALFADPAFDPEASAPGCVLPMALSGGGPGSPGFVSGVAECLAKDTSISVECATCYAKNAECSFASCAVLCLTDRNARECRDCRCGRSSDVNCFTLLDACTGMTSHYCDE